MNSGSQKTPPPDSVGFYPLSPIAHRPVIYHSVGFVRAIIGRWAGSIIALSKRINFSILSIRCVIALSSNKKYRPDTCCCHPSPKSLSPKNPSPKSPSPISCPIGRTESHRPKVHRPARFYSVQRGLLRPW